MRTTLHLIMIAIERINNMISKLIYLVHLWSQITCWRNIPILSGCFCELPVAADGGIYYEIRNTEAALHSDSLKLYQTPIWNLITFFRINSCVSSSFDLPYLYIKSGNTVFRMNTSLYEYEWVRQSRTYEFEYISIPPKPTVNSIEHVTNG